MEKNQLRLAVYTGSFDPITLGHLNVIQRASRLVDRLIVGVGINLEKQALFTADERVNLIQTSGGRLPERGSANVQGIGSRVCSGV